MNNRTQQKFDRSIREAVEVTKQAQRSVPRRAVAVLPDDPDDRKQPKGRLYLCPETGATVWEPHDPAR